MNNQNGLNQGLSRGDGDGPSNADMIRVFYEHGASGQRYQKCVMDAIVRVKEYFATRQRLSFIEELDNPPDSVWSVPISIRSLKAFSEEFGCNLYSRFLHYPTTLLLEAEKCLQEILLVECSADENMLAPMIIVSLHDNPDVISVNQITPEFVDCAITVEGVVIRATNIKPLMHKAAFQCAQMNPDGTSNCSHVDQADIVDNKVLMPQACTRCGRNSQVLCYHKSSYQNRQVIKIQDIQSTSSEWSSNQGIIAFVHDPLIDVAKPGDKVQLTGLFRCNTQRVRPTMSVVKSICKTYLDVIHIDKIEKVSKGLASFTETQFRALASRDRLLKIFAPGIAMLDTVKLGLLCALVGSSNVAGGRTSLHVLLCGDPATAKSQLMGAVKAVAERSVYVCGRGSTAAGLTASVVRDAETNEFLLEPGAVVVADRGICLLDEFDKIDESARIVLNEVMEQQTVSVAKAGIVCSLNARTSVIASANPIASRFDQNRSVMENLNMPLSLLSRFDLVYLLTDPNDTSYDREISKSLLSHWDPSKRVDRHMETDETETVGGQKKSDMELLLQAFISFAKDKIHPTTPDPVKEVLMRVYCDMRKNTSSTVITPRQLRALIRVSEALAKLELSAVVTEDHVRAAQQLISTSSEYLRHKADEDTTSTAKSGILGILGQAGSAGISEGDLWDAISAQGVERSVFTSAIRVMQSERLIASRVTPTGPILTIAIE